MRNVLIIAKRELGSYFSSPAYGGTYISPSGVYMGGRRAWRW